MAGSFAEAAEAAQRVLTAAQRDRAPPADEEGEDLSVAAAAVLLQARGYLGDSPAALRALMTWLWLRRATRRLRLPTAGAGMAAGNAAAG